MDASNNNQTQIIPKVKKVKPRISVTCNEPPIKPKDEDLKAIKDDS